MAKAKTKDKSKAQKPDTVFLNSKGMAKRITALVSQRIKEIPEGDKTPVVLYVPELVLQVAKTISPDPEIIDEILLEFCTANYYGTDGKKKVSKMYKMLDWLADRLDDLISELWNIDGAEHSTIDISLAHIIATTRVDLDGKRYDRMGVSTITIHHLPSVHDDSMLQVVRNIDVQQGEQEDDAACKLPDEHVQVADLKMDEQ